MDEREIVWIGSSYKDLMAMPEKVRRTFGYALGLAQNGLNFPGTKQLKGFTPALIEVIEDDDGDTYRAVYSARFKTAFTSCTASRRNPPGIVIFRRPTRKQSSSVSASFVKWKRARRNRKGKSDDQRTYHPSR